MFNNRVRITLVSHLGSNFNNNFACIILISQSSDLTNVTLWTNVETFQRIPLLHENMQLFYTANWLFRYAITNWLLTGYD